ncbi:MAG: hypothetical protein JRE23_01045 [Deltaproteobacteria bacterium]|nr:hypothetical protein [Deltaproteobacteria bacterium]
MLIPPQAGLDACVQQLSLPMAFQLRGLLEKLRLKRLKRYGVHSEMVDFVPRQGHTKVYAAGVVPPERDGERSIGAKDAFSGWTLIIFSEDKKSRKV